MLSKILLVIGSLCVIFAAVAFFIVKRKYFTSNYFECFANNVLSSYKDEDIVSEQDTKRLFSLAIKKALSLLIPSGILFVVGNVLLVVGIAIR